MRWFSDGFIYKINGFCLLVFSLRVLCVLGRRHVILPYGSLVNLPAPVRTDDVVLTKCCPSNVVPHSNYAAIQWTGRLVVKLANCRRLQR